MSIRAKCRHVGCKDVLFWHSVRVDSGGMSQPRAVRSGTRPLHVVRGLAGEQDGVVTRAQLLARGISESAIKRAVRAGRLHRLHPGVYSVSALELLTPDAVLTAALLAAGDGATLSHGTAAWRWRIIRAAPARIELSVPHRRALLDGVTLFRPQRLRPGDVVTDRGVRITSVPRTALDLAVRYEHRALIRMLEEAEFQHDLRPADVTRTLRRGHRGSANLRAALDAHVPGHGEAKSHLERGFRRLLIKHGIELPLRNAQIGSWEVDCLWPAQRLVVEIDGPQHTRPAQAARDDERDLYLRRHGYVIRRYSDKQLSQQPDNVVEDLLAALALNRAA